MPCCSICKNNLTQRPETLPPNAPSVILAMECGHIFHQCCIKKWFRVQYTQQNQGFCPVCDKGVTVQEGRRVYLQEEEEDDYSAPVLPLAGRGPSGAASSSSYMNCRPSSSSLSSINSRPNSTGNQWNAPRTTNYSTEDYSDSDEDYYGSFEQKDDPEMGHVTAILEETGTELEQIRAQHEELELKYAYLASELDKFREDHNHKEREIMDNAYRDNWETNWELVSRRKEEAFSMMADLEARIRKLEDNDDPDNRKKSKQSEAAF